MANTKDKEVKENTNLLIYNQIKEVPDEAKKEIKGGRLSGMTDIKPMWRIEKLTELFGPCGLGWFTNTLNKEIIDGANGEKIAVVDIELYVNYKKPYNLEKDVWSKGIEGSGGSSFIAVEKKGLYTSDECFKMAYTDALSVACKNLGMGANVYWGDSKYATNDVENMTLEEAEKFTLEFGKYKGKKLSEVGRSYINWLLNNENTDPKVLKAIELLTGEVPKTDEEMDKQLEKTQKLMKVLVDKGIDEERVIDHYKVKNLNDLTEEQIDEMLDNWS